MEENVIFSTTRVQARALPKSKEEISQLRQLLEDHNLLSVVGIAYKKAQGSLRLNFTTQDQLDNFFTTLDALPDNHPVIEKVRELGGVIFTVNVVGDIRASAKNDSAPTRPAFRANSRFSVLAA